MQKGVYTEGKVWHLTMKSDISSSEEKYRRALDLLQNGTSPYFDRDALSLLEAAAKEGHGEAAYLAGSLHCYGSFNILANQIKAEVYTKMAVDAGITLALFQLINILDYAHDAAQISTYIGRLQSMAQNRDFPAMDILVRLVQKYRVEDIGISEEIKRSIISNAAQCGIASAQVPYISTMLHPKK